MAVTLPTSPVNEIAIVDIVEKRGWFLAHPNNLVKLAHPCFSPDGRHVALVVTPPTYFGTSEIWISPIEGGSSQIIRERPMGCFMLPQFSRDASRLVCFGDANQALPDEQPQLRSYRTGLVQMALCEINVSSGAISRIAQQGWSWVRLAAYAQNDDGFYLSTGLPSIRAGERWVPNPDAGSADPSRLGFFLRRGDEPSRELQSAVPLAIRQGDSHATLLGVASDGARLIRTSRANTEFRAGSNSVLVLCRSDACSDALAPEHAQIQEAAISGDGHTVVGRVVRTVSSESETTTPNDFHEYIVRSRLTSYFLRMPNEITFEADRRRLSADGPSELGS